MLICWLWGGYHQWLFLAIKNKQESVKRIVFVYIVNEMLFKFLFFGEGGENRLLWKTFVSCMQSALEKINLRYLSL